MRQVLEQSIVTESLVKFDQIMINFNRLMQNNLQGDKRCLVQLTDIF